MQYHEKQHFNQIWVKIITYCTLLVGIPTSFLFIIKESDYLSACLVFIFCILIFILFLKANLEFRISNGIINYKFFPFLLKSREIIIYETITLRVIRYDALSEFGGWGVRKNTTSTCYSTSGNFALQIKQNGKKDILLGTLQPEKLKNFLSYLKK